MNYKINAIKILLNKECVLSRYFPLIPYIEKILSFAKEKKVKTKNDCLKIDTFPIFNDEYLNKLFKRFLVLYDNENKLNLINKLSLDKIRLTAYKELFLLPGVKETRAELYFLSGYTSLLLIANSNVDEILSSMNKIIINKKLDSILPQVKEIKTHLAVAKVYSFYQ